MEAFAAFLEHTDAPLGRFVDALRDMGQLDNTLLVAMSDNGASQEGGRTGVLDEMLYFNGLKEDVDRAVGRLDAIGTADSHTDYPWGWAMCGNTPLKRYKQNTHAGGVRDPFVVHWPARVKDAARVPTRKRTQNFDMFGHRGIRHDGWKAVCFHKPGADYDAEAWELNHADADASEAIDLATAHPERLRELVALWWAEAERHGVLPLDDRRLGELFRAAHARGGSTMRDRYVLYPPLSRWNADVSPPTGTRPFVLAAEIELGEGRDGAIVARGGSNGGYVFCVRERRLAFAYTHFHEHTRVVSDVAPPPGPCTVAVRIERDGEAATATLLLDGAGIGSVRIPRTAAMVSSTGMDVGRSQAPVCDDYAPPFAFEGRIRRVVFDIAPRTPRTARREQVMVERRVQGSGFRVQGAGCRVQGAGCRVSSSMSSRGRSQPIRPLRDDPGTFRVRAEGGARALPALHSPDARARGRPADPGSSAERRNNPRVSDTAGPRRLAGETCRHGGVARTPRHPPPTSPSSSPSRGARPGGGGAVRSHFAPVPTSSTVPPGSSTRATGAVANAPSAHSPMNSASASTSSSARSASTSSTPSRRHSVANCAGVFAAVAIQPSAQRKVAAPGLPEKPRLPGRGRSRPSCAANTRPPGRSLRSTRRRCPAGPHAPRRNPGRAARRRRASRSRRTRRRRARAPRRRPRASSGRPRPSACPRRSRRSRRSRPRRPARGRRRRAARRRAPAARP
jgi:hypothetical protein